MFFYNISAIFRKEFFGYFSSPITYIIMGIFWLIAGFFFNSLLSSIILDVTSQEQLGVMLSRDIVYEFLNSFWGVIVFSLLLVILPALSMGLYAEERKLGTLELLATSPLTNWGVAVGKLLGVIAFFTVMIVPFWIYEAIIFSAASPPVQIKTMLLVHLGLILLASAILSIGMFVSSLTDSSFLAYIITFILVLSIWLLDVIGNSSERFFRDRIGGEVGERVGFFIKEVLSNLSWFESYNNFIRGVFDSSSLILFVSYIVLGIFLTAQSIEALRLQQK